ncbi:MAG: armadillo-type protein [Olpidium bornovanus]|uniref:Armadillo-type protein n=1 Tax=Olpidium bornovanus TaxID=278681 RepID=A0A8H7ZT51_9FUNG|nr:MAG: armadillo-type protein [Olpidium bornovanus]
MTTDQVQFLSHLEQLLAQLTSANPDSARIRTATTTLKAQFFCKPACVPALVELLQNSRDAQVRQLAAVELRKRVATFWSQVDEASREQIKRALLQCILQEPENLVRHSTARVISTIAKTEVPAQRWNDLVQFLHSCCQAPTAGHREVGYYVLFTLFDVVGNTFAEHAHDLLGLFARGLHDPESKEVRVTTLQALGRLSDYIEPENKRDVAAFRELVPAMVSVMQQCLNENDEESADLGFEVFDSLLQNVGFRNTFWKCGECFVGPSDMVVWPIPLRFPGGSVPFQVHRRDCRFLPVDRGEYARRR